MEVLTPQQLDSESSRSARLSTKSADLPQQTPHVLEVEGDAQVSETQTGPCSANASGIFAALDVAFRAGDVFRYGPSEGRVTSGFKDS